VSLFILAACATPESASHSRGSAPATERGNVATTPQPPPSTMTNSMNAGISATTNSPAAGKGAFEDQNLNGVPSPAGADNPGVVSDGKPFPQGY
jgi:hypothetical protein